MIDYEGIARCLIHPLQLRILHKFAYAEGMVRSPRQLADELECDLSNVSYHVRALAGDSKGPFAGRPLLELFDEKPRRGAVEHFYRLTKDALVDVEEAVPA